MCPSSTASDDDIESGGNDDQHQHQQQQQQRLRNYNEETIRSSRSAGDHDEDKFIHGFLRRIQVSQLLSRLPLNESREPLNQASILFPHSDHFHWFHVGNC